MDETKDTKGLSSETPGQASKGDEGNTSETEPQTYTKEQIDGIVAKAKSDALATAGRTATALEKREATVKAREDANKAEQERRDAAELAEAEKDPDKLAAYQSRQTERQRAKSLDEREANIARSEAEHGAEITAAKEAQKEITIWEVASAKSIDPMRLKTLSEKFNVEGKEKLEEMAEEIASKKGETDKGITVDSGLTKGGGKDLSGLSPQELAQKAYEK